MGHVVLPMRPSALLWAMLFLFIGSRVGERWEEVARLLEHHATGVAVVVLLLLLIAFVLWRWRFRRSHSNFQDTLS